MKINGKTIDMDELIRQFHKEYDFFYENADAYVAGEDEAMAFGDEVIRLRPDIVREFCAKRTVLMLGGVPTPIFDPLTSDREVAAFGFAINELYA